VVDYEAEHGRCPFFRREGWGQPLLADSLVCGCSAWQGECGVCEGDVFDSRSPGDLVADVFGILVGGEFGEVDGCWGWSESVACWDGQVGGFGAVGVAVGGLV
jgi:hypothetical protein